MSQGVAEEEVKTQEALVDDYDIDPTPIQEESLPAQGEETVAPEGTTSPEPVSPLRDDQGRFVSPKAESPKHPSRLLQTARELNFSEEEIASPDLKSNVLFELERRATAPTSPSQTVPPAGKLEPDPFAELEAELDPRLASILKSVLGDNKALKAKLATLEQSEQTRQYQTIEQQLDTVFSASDEKVFGKGAGATLGKGSAELERRFAVIKLAQTMPGQLSVNVQKAIELLYGKSTPQKVESEESAVEEYRNGALARPTHRGNSTEPLGRARALQAVRERMRANPVKPPDISDEFLS